MHPAANGSNCSTIMAEGERCTVFCSENFQRVGYFTCSQGVHVGDSICSPRGKGGSITAVTKIAGTVEVVIDVAATETFKSVEGYLKVSIAQALSMASVHVTKIAMREIGQGQGARRLESFQRKVYEVAYEILPPSVADVDLLVQRAHNMSTPGAIEWQLFRQAATAELGIIEVHQVLPKVVARKFADEVVGEAEVKGPREASLKRGESPMTVVLISSISVLLVSGTVCFYVGYRNAQTSTDQEVLPTPVIARVPSRTLLNSRGLAQIVPIPNAIEEWDLEEPAIGAHMPSHAAPKKCWTMDLDEPVVAAHTPSHTAPKKCWT